MRSNYGRRQRGSLICAYLGAMVLATAVGKAYAIVIVFGSYLIPMASGVFLGNCKPCVNALPNIWQILTARSNAMDL